QLLQGDDALVEDQKPEARLRSGVVRVQPERFVFEANGFRLRRGLVLHRRVALNAGDDADAGIGTNRNRGNGYNEKDFLHDSPLANNIAMSGRGNRPAVCNHIPRCWTRYYSTSARTTLSN